MTDAPIKGNTSLNRPTRASMPGRLNRGDRADRGFRAVRAALAGEPDDTVIRYFSSSAALEPADFTDYVAPSEHCSA